MANRVLRNSKSFFTYAVVAGLASPTACSSYADYSGPKPDNSSTKDSGGGRGGQAGSGEPGGAGKTGASGGADASADGREASSDAQPDTALHHRDASAPCGMTTDGGGQTTRIDFSCPQILRDFEFINPKPIVTGNGQWFWAASGGKPFLLGIGDVKAYPAGFAPGGLTYLGPEEGTFAIYRPLEIENVSVSVQFRSDDDDTFVLIARYQDEFNYYSLLLNHSVPSVPATWDLRRVGGTAGGAEIARGTLPNPDTYFSTPHRVGLVLRGAELTPSLDGVPLGGPYWDTPNGEAGANAEGGANVGFGAGRVGVETILLSEVEIDEIEITKLP